MPCIRRFVAACVLCAALAAVVPAPVPAQTPLTAAPAIAPVLAELDRLQPIEDSSFRVRNFIITRDAATLSLQDGRMWPLTTVNGRTIGAIFMGQGRLLFKAPTPVERERMRHYLGVEELDAPLTSVVLFFTDGTLDDIYRTGFTAEHAEAPGPLRQQLARARDYLKTYKDRTWDPSFLEPILNGRENGMFFAMIQRERGEELILQLDPDDPEPVRLGVKDQAPGADVDPEWVTQFAWTDRPAPPRDARRRQVSVARYVLDVRMPQALDGGVSFAATADAHLQVPDDGYGPWIPFFLYPELDVDSARWNGAQIEVYKNNDAYYMWVRAPTRLERGDTPVLRLNYHGDLLERYGDWFVLKSSIGWYPSPVDGLAKASFDITYHTPVGHPIGSIGVLTDSSTSGRMVTTHWVHAAPMRNASFNIGRFQSYDISTPGSPPVTLLWSEAGHRAFATGDRIATERNVKGVITDEVASAMRFFTSVYGPPQEPRFFATEIPGGHGEAFPGLVHLSYFTFMGTDQTGYNQSFRAHEVAHQWWGIGVDFASYRDRWLSEGIADFSGLWYMQTRRGEMDKYLGMLREWRGNILAARGRLGAVSLGGRTGTGRDPQYYSYAVYQKGAWTMHMLRILLLQLSTMNEDRFTNAMREFYSTYNGRSASTDDLRQVMEKHAGADLGWFFDQWIDGTQIPTYTWAWHAEPADGGRFRVKLRVKQTNVPPAFQMWVPVTVELNDGRMLRTRILVTGPVTETELPLLPGAVKSVKFNDLEGVLADVKSEGW
ncbi:MAG: M1 family aminopeptidase [Gemmatimonadales bacterium]